MQFLVEVAENPRTPTLTAVTPASGPASGGTPFEARGLLLAANCTLLFGNVPARDVSLRSSAFPRSAPATYRVDVRDSLGKLAAGGASVTIVAEGVALRSITPPCGSTAGNDSVSIHGSGFLQGATVKLDGVAATDVQFISANELRATTPAGVAGLAQIAVTNPDGSSDTMSAGFRYRSPSDPAGCGGKSRGVRH